MFFKRNLALCFDRLAVTVCIYPVDGVAGRTQKHDESHDVDGINDGVNLWCRLALKQSDSPAPQPVVGGFVYVFQVF